MPSGFLELSLVVCCMLCCCWALTNAAADVLFFKLSFMICALSPFLFLIASAASAGLKPSWSAILLISLSRSGLLSANSEFTKFSLSSSYAVLTAAVARSLFVRSSFGPALLLSAFAITVLKSPLTPPAGIASIAIPALYSILALSI